MELLKQLGQFALTQMNEGAAAIDNRNCVLAWSAGMERMFGFTGKEVLGKNLTELLPFIIGDFKAIGDARNGSSCIGGVHQYFVEGRNAHARIQFTYSPLKDNDEITGLLCFVRETDTTSDLQKLSGLLNQRLRLLADAMPGLMWLCDQAGDRFMFNAKWLEFTGRTLNEEKGRGWMHSIEQQDRQRLWKTCTAALNDHSGYHVQYRLRRADGQTRLILETGVPQVSDDGVFLGMMGSCNDLSTTRNTQQSLTAPVVDNFTSTLDNAPLAIWRMDRDLVVRKANPAVSALMHLPSEQIVGKPLTTVVPSMPATIFNAVLKDGERVHMENYTVVLQNSKGPREVAWDVVAWPLRDSDGKVVGVAMSSSEVSEKQRMSHQRDDFVAALVHDLKTPLVGADRTLEQIINGALGSLDTAQTDVLNMLRRSNHQLLLMVQNLIEVYRYEAGQPDLAIETFDVCSLITVAMSELKALAAHRGITLTADLPESVMISGDRLSLRRVFLNLLDNALKFTARRGIVTITCRTLPDAVEFKVTDTGIGITKSDQKKLFQQFWQGDAGKRFAPGTGLGLYLCKQIISAHGGTIAVDSAFEKGTSFVIVLPSIPDGTDNAEE